ncbi:MAG: ParB/RepB/Spo0J family partition protein [Patescibacteria group bacterium]|nr:ParB/RepB/Spo0J family partition protein [Patescibacteria group bacterium]
MSESRANAVFWIEVDKIRPNPFQPRKEFDEDKIQTLADSIRQYGILQPLVVTRQEVSREDGGIGVEYELIAGERRWRASQVAGISQVPAVIRDSEESDKLKLEMAIIENLQREDLNPVDRAHAFQQLTEQFGLKHHEVGKRVGRSREYVSNTIRIAALPEEMLQALVEGKINEGHTRPLLMLNDRPEQQLTFFQELLVKKMTVREAESIARRIAYDKVRKKDHLIDPQIVEIEQQLTEQLGTRVRVERKDVGGKVLIDFFSPDDLSAILNLLSARQQVTNPALEQAGLEESVGEGEAVAEGASQPEEGEEGLYDLKNFSI